MYPGAAGSEERDGDGLGNRGAVGTECKADDAAGKGRPGERYADAGRHAFCLQAHRTVAKRVDTDGRNGFTRGHGVVVAVEVYGEVGIGWGRRRAGRDR